MRMARIKPKGRVVVYHCVSRIVGGQRLLGAIEKEKFRKLIWAQADFCGVEILSYCVMSNHFHILVRVPERVLCDDATLIERVSKFYGPKHSLVSELGVKMKSDGKIDCGLRERLLARMGDVSCFLKELKQRFSSWYNRQNSRFGTLWAERFRSTIVENMVETLRVVAGYIDLNPVRAGIVKDPKDYRFCNYAEALAGRESSRRAIMNYGKGEKWGQVAADYRECLFVKGGRSKGSGDVAIDRATILREIKRGAKLSPATLLRLRIRYVADGVALGSVDFVNEIYREYRDRFGHTRSSGARSVTGALSPIGFSTLRDLKKNPFR